MANYNLYYPLAFQLEGTAYENDPNDECTKFGIVKNDLQTFYGHQATCADVKALTSEIAQQVLKKLYWDKFLADSIQNQSVAEFLVDSGFNQGVGGISAEVQKVVGVAVDGIIGNKTLAAINSHDQFDLYHQVYIFRLKRYTGIVTANPKKQVYLRGWINRLNAIPFKK